MCYITGCETLRAHKAKYMLFYIYKQHFYKQRQAEIRKKTKQMLSNTLRLNFFYLKIIHIFYKKILGYILENKQKKKRVYIHEVIRLI